MAESVTSDRSLDSLGSDGLSEESRESESESEGVVDWGFNICFT